jgi:uncharacterized membrane protein
MLLVGRAVVTGLVVYAFLLWNLFLAYIPYGITQWVAGRDKIFRHSLLFCLVSLTWLLFIPNSFYIVTDLFHLHKFDDAPKWFDLLLIFSFAWNGLLLGLLSVRAIEKMHEVKWGRGFSTIFLFTVMWLCAFGVYVGRYLRFNSWDIVSQPFALVQEMMALLLHPIYNKMEWGMISTYAIFMLMIYITLKKISGTFYHVNK